MIEQLTVEMARTPSVEPEQAEDVLEEFVEASTARGYIAEGGFAMRARCSSGRSGGSARPRS